MKGTLVCYAPIYSTTLINTTLLSLTYAPGDPFQCFLLFLCKDDPCCSSWHPSFSFDFPPLVLNSSIMDIFTPKCTSDNLSCLFCKENLGIVRTEGGLQSEMRSASLKNEVVKQIHACLTTSFCFRTRSILSAAFHGSGAVGKDDSYAAVNTRPSIRVSVDISCSVRC